jgi:hypothetical protein
MIIPVFVSIVNLGHLTKVVSLIPAYGEVYLIQHYGIKFVMVFNATFYNISWWSVLLVEETGVHRENY